MAALRALQGDAFFTRESAGRIATEIDQIKAMLVSLVEHKTNAEAELRSLGNAVHDLDVKRAEAAQLGKDNVEIIHGISLHMNELTEVTRAIGETVIPQMQANIAQGFAQILHWAKHINHTVTDATKKSQKAQPLLNVNAIADAVIRRLEETLPPESQTEPHEQHETALADKNSLTKPTPQRDNEPLGDSPNDSFHSITKYLPTSRESLPSSLREPVARGLDSSPEAVSPRLRAPDSTHHFLEWVGRGDNTQTSRVVAKPSDERRESVSSGHDEVLHSGGGSKPGAGVQRRAYVGNEVAVSSVSKYNDGYH